MRRRTRLPRQKAEPTKCVKTSRQQWTKPHGCLVQTDEDDFKDAGEGGGVTAGMLLGQMLGEAAAKSSSDAEFGAMAREVLRTGPY